MRGRASVQQDGAEVVAAAASFGQRSGVRQYRDHRLEWMLKHGGEDIVREGLARGTIKFSPDV